MGCTESTSATKSRRRTSKSRDPPKTKTKKKRIQRSPTPPPPTLEELSSSGSFYEGELMGDMKHGFGVYHYRKNHLYNGEKEKYVGDWRANRRHGKGTYIFRNGNEYTGLWKEDDMHGYGVLSNPDTGHYYEGYWEKSYWHGQGTLRSENGNVYEGNWIRGREEGLGVLTETNGNIYAGYWREGDMHGYGIVYEAGHKYTVDHINGILLSKDSIKATDAVDPCWDDANSLYEEHRKGKKKKKLEVEKKRSPEVASDKSAAGELKERMDAAMVREKTLLREIEELKLKLRDATPSSGQVGDSKDRQDLDQKQDDLERQREINTRLMPISHDAPPPEYPVVDLLADNPLQTPPPPLPLPRRAALADPNGWRRTEAPVGALDGANSREASFHMPPPPSFSVS